MIRRKRLLSLLLVLIAIVAVLHFFGFYLELYWRIGWYDRVVHTLGGIWIALLFLFIIHILHIQISRKVVLFVATLMCALIIGTLWEVFEVKSGINNIRDSGYMFDTIGDIVCDCIGASIGYLYINFSQEKLWKSEQ